MKQIFNYILSIVVCVIGVEAYAQLGADSTNEPPPASSTDIITEETEEQMQGFELSAFYILGSQAYDLSGTGFNSDFSTQRSGASGQLLYKENQNWWTLNYRTDTSEIDVPTGLTPSNIERTDTYVSIERQQFFNRDKSSWKNLYFILGMEYKNSEVELTTPNALLAELTQIGVKAGLGYFNNIFTDLSYEVSATLSIPLLYWEGDEKTGYLKYSLSPTLRSLLIYRLSSKFDIVGGATLSYDIASYDGTGTRGTTDATETILNIYFPVGVKFKF